MPPIPRSTTSTLLACKTIINYTFSNPTLLLKAITASSHLNTTNSPLNYNALAVLGDIRTEAVLSNWWWKKNSTHNRAQWSTIQKVKCSNAALAMLGRKSGLGACLVTSRHTPAATDNMIATMVEAVLGAVYLDGGEGELEKVMRRLGFHRHVYL